MPYVPAETAQHPIVDLRGYHSGPSGRRSHKQRLLLAINAVLIIAGLGAAGMLSWVGGRASDVNRVALGRSLTEVSDNRGEQVVNILLVGSDSSANLDPDDPIQIGRKGERLGDVIIIAHLDQRTGDVALLSLPRDLWVPIAGTSREDRINRAFVVGGAATLIDTIEENFEIPIHHFVNVDFAGFQGLVEAVGSVEVPFDTPARDWNTNAGGEGRSQTGFFVHEAGCQALGPEQALAYVRSRYYQTQDVDGSWHTDPTSDFGRIRRQQEFLRRLAETAVEQGARNPVVLGDIIDTSIQNVAIDERLTPGILIDLSSGFRHFEPSNLQTYTYPAIDAKIGSSRVLRPIHGEAGGLRNLFAGERFDDPGSVDLTVSYSPGITDDLVVLSSSEDPTRLNSNVPGGSDGSANVNSVNTSTTRFPLAASAVVEALQDAGFVMGAVSESDIGPGITIVHGRNGHQAAQLVAGSLSVSAVNGLEVTFREEMAISGRNVRVEIGRQATIDAENGSETANEGIDQAQSADLSAPEIGGDAGQMDGVRDGANGSEASRVSRSEGNEEPLHQERNAVSCG